jgi:hypothetical protein
MEIPGIKLQRGKKLPAGSIVPSRMGFVNWRLDFAHLRFLWKDPSPRKTPAKKRLSHGVQAG